MPHACPSDSKFNVRNGSSISAVHPSLVRRTRAVQIPSHCRLSALEPLAAAPPEISELTFTNLWVWRRKRAVAVAFEPDGMRIACDEVLGNALAYYEEVVGDTIPDKMPMPLKVHRHTGEPCPRCGTTLEAVHFRDYVTTYCPAEQTGGRVLKDRRLSKLLK